MPPPPPPPYYGQPQIPGTDLPPIPGGPSFAPPPPPGTQVNIIVFTQETYMPQGLQGFFCAFGHFGHFGHEIIKIFNNIYSSNGMHRYQVHHIRDTMEPTSYHHYQQWHHRHHHHPTDNINRVILIRGARRNCSGEKHQSFLLFYFIERIFARKYSNCTHCENCDGYFVSQ